MRPQERLASPVAHCNGRRGRLVPIKSPVVNISIELPAHKDEEGETMELRAESTGVGTATTTVERHWRDIPRNARLTEAETLAFFCESGRAADLPDGEVIDRCIFLVRHAPPTNYQSLRIKSKFVQLAKRLEKFDWRYHCLSRDDCLQPDGVVWKTGVEIETAGRDYFPPDVMTCTITNDLFKLWPVLSFMQGIGTLHQVDGRAIDLGRKIVHLLGELARKHPALAKLLDPPTVIFNLQATKVDPSAVVIPPGLAPGNVPAFPGAVGIWTCPSELRAGEFIGHLRVSLAPELLPGVVPQFHYINAPIQNL